MKLLRFFWDTHGRALPFVGELKWVSDKEHVMAWGDRQYALFRICLNNVPIQPQLNCCPSTSGLCSSCQQGGTTLGPSRLNSQSVSTFQFSISFCWCPLAKSKRATVSETWHLRLFKCFWCKRRPMATGFIWFTDHLSIHQPEGQSDPPAQHQ